MAQFQPAQVAGIHPAHIASRISLSGAALTSPRMEAPRGGLIRSRVLATRSVERDREHRPEHHVVRKLRQQR
jgi:hypothetical protein